MKIGIITFSRAYNAGAVLQAYALQEFLKKSKYDVKIIDFTLRSDYIKYKPWIITLNPFLNLSNFLSFFYKLKQKNVFEKFRKQYFRLTERKYVDGHEMSDLNNDFDMFIAGSDQIWNINLTGKIIPEFFLRFSKKKKIAYAASFGSSIFSSDIDELNKMISYINNFDYISIREQSGVAWCNKYCKEKKALHVCDPTLLFDASFYLNLIKGFKPKYYYESYIFVVDYSARNEYLEKYCEKLALENNLRIIHISSMKFSNKISAIKLHYINPESFLYYISNASYVITTSYHCLLFSILFQKNFGISPSCASDSRLNDFLQTVGLSNRLIHNQFDIKAIIDYEKIADIIEEFKSKSQQFLLNCIQSG